MLLEQLMNGLGQGAIYALMSIGYALIFGVVGLVTFVHGDVIMLGAFTAYYRFAYLGSSLLPSLQYRDKNWPGAENPAISFVPRCMSKIPGAISFWEITTAFSLFFSAIFPPISLLLFSCHKCAFNVCNHVKGCSP